MLIYLASPYTHPDKNVEDDRFEAVVAVAGRLISHGYHIFSPIAMCHPIARKCKLETKFDYWQEFDRKMLGVCDQLWILTLREWQLSVGIAAEISTMRRLDKPIFLIDSVSLDRLPL